MDKLINSIKECIITAGQIAIDKKRTGLKIDKKIDYSIVTNADLAISQFIFNWLTQLTPTLPIVCEERPLFALNTDSFWLIDPIDGTRSYSKGKATYTVNICLIDKLMPKLGFIYQPEINKLYYTNSEAKLVIEQDGMIIDQSPTLARENLSAVVSSHNLNTNTKNFLENYKITEITAIASSIKFCLVAEGTVDIYPRFDQIMEWDVAAGHALIKAAGGEVYDFDNQALTYGKASFKHPFFVAIGKKWMLEKFN